MENLRPYVDIWSRELAQTIEMMTGSSTQVASEPSPEVPDGTWWETTFSSEAGLHLAVGAPDGVWSGISASVLEAAGLDQNDLEEVQNTWIEILQQAAGSTARRLSERKPKPVECTTVKRGRQPAAGERFQVRIVLGRNTYVMSVCLAASAGVPAQAPGQSASKFSPVSSPPAHVSAPAPSEDMSPAFVSPSRTMDALLDVHLPVSLSFGQARIPLRDVLKLNTGSVVELNRQPEDPVDVIVNDCVIARGEVVVVNGNYAVRIQSIIGRPERLRLSSARADAREIRK